MTVSLLISTYFYLRVLDSTSRLSNFKADRIHMVSKEGNGIYDSKGLLND